MTCLIYFVIGILICFGVTLDTGKRAISELPMTILITLFWPILVVWMIFNVNQLTFHGKVIWRKKQ